MSEPRHRQPSIIHQVIHRQATSQVGNRSPSGCVASRREATYLFPSEKFAAPYASPLSLHRNNKKHFATPLFALAVLSIFCLPLPAFAGQTVNINGSVTGNVFGNGSGTNNTTQPPIPTPNAEGNTVNVNSGGAVTDMVYGGLAIAYTDTTTVSDNIVNTNGGAVTGRIYGGASTSGTGTSTAAGNSVNINGAAAVSDVYGGSAVGYSRADATGNSVNISNGATVNGTVYAGRTYSSSGTAIATDNTVTIIGNPTFGAFTTIYGGYTETSRGTAGDAFTGNTLNIHTSGLAVANVHNFENLNFYLPSSFAANQTVLTVTGTADLTDGAGRSSVVNVGIDGASSPLKEGDTVTLISAATLVTNSALNTTTSSMQGVSLQCEFALDWTTDANKLFATVTEIGLNEQTKSFSEARLSQLAFANQGSDPVLSG